MASNLITTGGRRKGRRAYGGHALRAEINVTPFVDVMLVLLIVFMVSAPLLTVGVPVNLPKAAAPTLNESIEPVNISLNADGQWFIGDQPVANETELQSVLETVTQGDRERKIYVRGDSALRYGDIMRVMAAVTTAGYSRLALISATPSPSASSSPSRSGSNGS